MKQPFVNHKPISHGDYLALRYLMKVSDGGKVAKAQSFRVFDKAYREGRLSVTDVGESQEQRWWRCEARFLHGYYEDWSGWECRDPWAYRVWFDNPFPVPVWTGGKVDRLYVVSEQGLGDEVLFLQALERVYESAKEIIVETQPRLQSIVERNFRCRTVPAKIRDDGMRVKQDFEADAWVTIGEICRTFLRSRDDFKRRPYLKADPARVSEYRSLAGRVGISWRGRQGEEKRLIDLFPDAISLQYDQEWDEEVERPDVDLKNDLEGVLGVLANLSKLVTVSTTVAHLASAMGIETHVIVADPKTGRFGGLIPWKWVNEKMPGRSIWYSDATSTYKGLEDYAKVWKLRLRF